MSKRCAAVSACLLVATVVWAQPASEQRVIEQAKQHERIRTLRQERTAELDAQELACTAKFAVTDCQNNVNARRREMQADLKRQELLLNESERKQKAADQLGRSRERAADWSSQQADAQSRPRGSTLEQRQKDLDEKRLDHQRKVKPVSAAANVRQPTTAKTPEAELENRQVYAEKQRAAEQRRLERDKRLREKASGGAAPLPLLPSSR